MRLIDEISQKKQVFLNNVSLVSEDIRVLREERQLLLRDYFESLLTDTPTFEIAVERLLSAQNEFSHEGEGDRQLENEERFIIATILSQNYPLQSVMRGQNALHPLPRKAKVACLNTNGFAALAYEKIHGFFSDWEAIGAENYTEVCELIENNLAIFGILPIENSTNGRLSGFYSMLDKYDLKICAVCDVEDEVNESTTRFALVSRVFYHPLYTASSKCVEISSASSNASTVLKLISAAEHFHIPVKRLSSTPLYYRGNTCVDTVTFELFEKNMNPFLIYLYLFNKDITILGFYVQL